MPLLTAIIFGFLLDLLFGDPAFIFHIVIGIGRMITALEKALRRLSLKMPKHELAAGALLATAIPFLCFGLTGAALRLAKTIHPALQWLLTAFICWQCLAARSLASAGRQVEKALASPDIKDARFAVSQIVGRDVSGLDRCGIIRATVETIAENTCDGVIAPLFWLAIGGAPLGVFYKAVNTLDSMVGYKNEKYLYFGRTSAKLDDMMNFIPARITALLIITAAALCKFDAKSAWQIFLRDRYNHKSPNSAQSEAACAGALGIRLGGNAVYFGETVEKPTIGEARRECTPDDINSANRLMLLASALGLMAVVMVRGSLLLWRILTKA